MGARGPAAAGVVADGSATHRDASEGPSAEGQGAYGQPSHRQKHANGEAAEAQAAEREAAYGDYAPREASDRDEARGHVAYGDDSAGMAARLSVSEVGSRGDGEKGGVAKAQRRPVPKALAPSPAEVGHLGLQLVDPALEVLASGHEGLLVRWVMKTANLPPLSRVAGPPSAFAPCYPRAASRRSRSQSGTGTGRNAFMSTATNVMRASKTGRPATVPS